MLLIDAEQRKILSGYYTTIRVDSVLFQSRKFTLVTSQVLTRLKLQFEFSLIYCQLFNDQVQLIFHFYHGLFILGLISF
jgi:hypothetical protein